MQDYLNEPLQQKQGIGRQATQNAPQGEAPIPTPEVFESEPAAQLKAAKVAAGQQGFSQIKTQIGWSAVNEDLNFRKLKEYRNQFQTSA